MKNWKIWLMVTIIYSIVYSFDMVKELQLSKSFVFKNFEYAFFISLTVLKIAFFNIPFLFFSWFEKEIIKIGNLRLIWRRVFVFGLYSIIVLIVPYILSGNFHVYSMSNGICLILSVAIYSLALRHSSHTHFIHKT